MGHGHDGGEGEFAGDDGEDVRMTGEFSNANEASEASGGGKGIYESGFRNRC